MRFFLHAMRKPPHAEEHAQHASRSTHDRHAQTSAAFAGMTIVGVGVMLFACRLDRAARSVALPRPFRRRRRQGSSHPARLHHAGRQVAAGGASGRRRSALSHLAARLRGQAIRRALGRRSGRAPARVVAMGARRPHRLGRLDPDHAGGAPPRTAPAARHRDQARADRARGAARSAERQVRHNRDVSDAGAVRRQSRRRARRVARLFRQGAGATDARRGGAAGGASAIARAAAPRPAPQRRTRRPRQGAGAASSPMASSPRNRNRKRAPSRCPTAASPCRSPRRIWRSIWSALAPGAEIDTWIDGELQRAAETLARDEARWFGDGGEPRRHRRGEFDAARRRLCRRRRFLRPPRRPARSRAPRALARLGAEALHLRHGVRRRRDQSRDPDRRRADALRRLRAQGFRPRLSRHGQRAARRWPTRSTCRR